MSNKKLGLILLGVAVLCIAGFGVYTVAFKKPEPKPAVDLSNEQLTQQQGTNSTKESKQNDIQGSVTLTKAEVQKHNSSSDCWTIISGKVYNVTDFISRHPGGSEILRACGTDATTLFTTRHTESGEAVGSGTPHSSNAQSQLDQFLLGDLQQ